MKCLHFLKLFHEDYEDVIHTRCLAHILNLSVKNGLCVIQDPVISAVSKLVNLINAITQSSLFYWIRD